MLPAIPPEHLPNRAFFDRDLELVPWDLSPHFRAYQTRHPDPLGFAPASSRFSDPRIGKGRGDVFGTVYFATRIETCTLEAIIRDTGVGQNGPRIPISRRFLQSWSIASVTSKTPLQLLDLRGAGALVHHVPTDAIRALDHRLGQAWAGAVHAHKDAPDGIIFSSRLNEQSNVALFDRALPRITLVDAAPLFAYRAELAAILNTYDIALV
jgi:hypothetical protein